MSLEPPGARDDVIGIYMGRAVSLEGLGVLLRAFTERAPQMPPNSHKQPTIATSSNLQT